MLVVPEVCIGAFGKIQVSLRIEIHFYKTLSLMKLCYQPKFQPKTELEFLVQKFSYQFLKLDQKNL